MSFDVCGPLPTGTTVLEASAGTGKTWTVAALATRYVAEGHAEPSELLVATFSRAATQELRERVRDRFTTTARELAAPEHSSDALVRHLARCDDGERETRRVRLVQALAEFDAATIATTHSFCAAVLDSLGLAGDLERGVTVVESVDDLVDEVADDLYLRKYARHDAPTPAMTAADARVVARAAVHDRHARLLPDGADATTEAGQRVGLATIARIELAARKREFGRRDYDDLLTLLRDVLVDAARGPAACRRLRKRYRVVLVDEFQDTDPVQWQVLRAGFVDAAGGPPSTLVLIGDPKQAVYGFRGAEVLSYLDAVRSAESFEGLGTNRRTDGALLAALDHLHSGVALGHPRIVVRPIAAAQPDRRLAGAVPLRLRVLDRTQAGPLGTRGFPAVAALRERVADDVAAELVKLVEGSARLAVDGPARAVRPGDVAVLVRTRSQGRLVQAALEARAVPCVLTGGSSVFATEAAQDWLAVLQAMQQPQRAGLLRRAALTCLFGHSATELDASAADEHRDTLLEQVGAQLRQAAGRFSDVGIASVADGLGAATALQQRLLSQLGGERRLTDVRHLAQLLQRASVEHALGLAALVSWLADRIDDPESGSTADRTRRLETDAAAVQIATVHTSKGLEYPVVFVPFGWDAARHPYPSTLRLHDAGGARVLDVGGRTGAGYEQRRRQSGVEDDAEELRLLYVAVTRAQCHVVLWWAPSAGTATAPLHRLLLGRREGSSELDASVVVPQDAAAQARLTAWGWPQTIAVETVDAVLSVPWQSPVAVRDELAAARFDRSLDTGWRRTSYSGLTAASHARASGGSEPEALGATDEPEAPPMHEPGSSSSAELRTMSPFEGLPAGAAFGTLVHEVLERVDASAPDLRGELVARCRDAVRGRLAGVDPATLADALLPVLHTPLATRVATLADISPTDRLAELDFELPLSGGDRPRPSSARLMAVAGLLRAHLSVDDPLVSYPDRLAVLGDAALRGFLSGSIDAVLRLPGPSYVVVDYKTNRLASGPLTVAHYSREAMAREMLRAHYPLQALLYCVALHRYLRWRQPGYNPQRHLGGVQYLFVRGMAGPETPPGHGVFDWRPPAALVTELSDLLAGSP